MQATATPAVLHFQAVVFPMEWPLFALSVAKPVGVCFCECAIGFLQVSV